MARKAEALRAQDFRWWAAEDDEELWHRVQAATKRISERTRTRREMDMHHAELYGAMQLAGLSPQNYDSNQEAEFVPTTLSFNLVARNIDAVVAKTAKNRPLPMFITQGGKPDDKEKAERLNKFIGGVFYETKQYETSEQICRDACTFGIGIQANFERYGEIAHERVLPWELRVDPNEAMYGKPRTIYQYRWVDRFVLADLFPEHAEYIENDAACTDEDEQWIGYDSTADQILLKESWHLRSGKKADDGRHAVTIEGRTLLSEPYERDYFPFSMLYFKRPLIGFWGIGIAQELTGIQFEINAMAEKIQEGYLTTGSYWWIPDSSKILDSSIVNGLGTVVRSSGGNPEKYDPPGISADTMSYINFLLQRAPQETGMSELSMNAQKPAGLNSGKALETYNDIESENFQLFGRAFENFHCDVAKQDIDLARGLDGYKVRSLQGKSIEIITLEDTDLDASSYVMQVFPTSFLANTPADRFQQVQDYANAGYITPAQAKSLMQIPDVESETSMDTAAHRVLVKWLSRMVKTGDPKACMASSYMEFADALPTALKFYWMCEDDEQSEEKLELVRNFITELKAQIDEENQKKAGLQAPNAAPGALMAQGQVPIGAPAPVMPGPAPGGGAPPMPGGPMPMAS